MIPRSVLVLLAIVLVVSLSACGGSKTTPTQAAGGSATAVATATTAAAEAEPEATSAEVAPTQVEEEDLDLDSVSSGIAQLASYKSKLDVAFVGTDEAGQAVAKLWSMEDWFIVDPPTQQLTWNSSETVGDAAPTTSSWSMTTIGDVRYLVSFDADGTETCMMLTSDDAEPPTSALSADMWGSIRDARYLGTDTVNGVRAKHYSWKEGALDVWGLTEGKGETWLAVDGGYVVKQFVEGQGKGVFMAQEGETGTTRWEWNITDANKDFAIVAPEGCESAAGDIPVMPDATSKNTMGDLLTYESPSTLAEVVAFYQAEMPQAGWEISGEPMTMDAFAQFEFTKEDSKASVMLSWDEEDQSTSVLISVGQQ